MCRNFSHQLFCFIFSSPGGGYTCQLGMRSHDIQTNINKLHKEDWIDGYTRSVVLEFLIVNTQVNLTTMVQVILEMIPTGVADSTVNVMTISDMGVFGYYWWWWWVVTSMQVSFGLIMLVKLVGGVNSILEHGREYLTSFTHLVSFIDMLLSVASAGFLGLEYMTQRENYFLMSFSDHQQIYWQQTMTSSLLACLAFISSWRVMLFLRVFKVFEARLYILRHVFHETYRATPMFVVAILALAYPGWLLFGGVTEYFHTMWTTIRSLHNLLLGGLYWDAITEPAMPYYIMCFQVVVHFIVFLAVCTVVIQTYSSTRVQETLNQFVNFGKITKLARVIRNRIVTKRILRKVRLRKAIIARGWRRGRNSVEPVSQDRKLMMIKRRMERLVKNVHAENKILFKNPQRLVKVAQRVVKKNIDNLG